MAKKQNKIIKNQNISKNFAEIFWTFEVFDSQNGVKKFSKTNFTQEKKLGKYWDKFLNESILRFESRLKF